MQYVVVHEPRWPVEQSHLAVSEGLPHPNWFLVRLLCHNFDIGGLVVKEYNGQEITCAECQTEYARRTADALKQAAPAPRPVSGVQLRECES